MRRARWSKLLVGVVAAAVAVEIGAHASGACHSAVVDDLVLPIFAAIVLRVEHMHAAAFAAVASGDVV